MKIEKIKKMMDACYMAKRIRELLPKLPEGVTSSYIRYLDVIHQLECRNGRVKISDVSTMLNLPRPGVTRTVKEMEAKGYLKKIASEEDGRIMYITITDAGEKLSEKYNRQFFGSLSESLGDISDADADCTIRTIEKIYEIMCERKGHFE